MLKFHVEIEGSIGALQYVRKELSNLTEFYTEYAYPKMLRDLDKLFEVQGRPKWSNLKDKYAKWKSVNYPGLTILQLQGLLRDSYTISSHPQHNVSITHRTISVYSSVEYAPLHESGTGDMDARPVVGSLSIDQGLRNQYNKQFKRHVQRVITKSGHAAKVSVRTAAGKRGSRSRPQIRAQTRTQQLGNIRRS